MCRILGLVLTPPPDSSSRREAVSTAFTLLDAFLKASREDPYLAALGAPEPSHCHGWGYVVVASTTAGGYTLYARGDEGTCSANLATLATAVERVKEAISAHDWSRLVAIIHSRRAGRKEPRGPLHAHPYHYTHPSRHGEQHFFLVHNGSLEKDFFTKTVGLDPSSYTDTAAAFYWLAKKLAAGAEPATLYRRLTGYTRTALNTVLLHVKPGSETVVATAYTRPGLDAARTKYYQFYMLKAESLLGFASSTVIDTSTASVDAEEMESEIVVVEPATGTVSREKL